MAELRPLGRQIKQPNAPDISGAGAAYKAIGDTVNTAAKAFGEYKQAAKETEAAALYTDYAHALDKTMLEHATPEQIKQGKAYDRYQQNSDAIIGTLKDMVPGELGDNLVLKLKSQANNNALKILAKENEEATNANKAIIENALATSKTAYTEAIPTGNVEARDQARQEYEQLLDNAIKLGLKDETDRYAAKLTLDEIDIRERFFQRGINDALARPGDAEKQLEEFAVNYKEHWKTNAEAVLAVDSYLKGLNQINRQRNEQRALNAAQTSLDIDQDKITTPAEIYTQNLTALQGIQAESHLWKHQHKVNTRSAKVNAFLNRVQQGAGLQNMKVSDEVKEEGFQVLDQVALNAKRELTGDEEATLTVEDQAQVLKQANVSRPSYNAQIDYALEKGDVLTELPLIDWSLAMMRTVSKEKPNTVDISHKSRAIANLANTSIQYGRTNPQAAIEAARNTVNVDEVTLKGRKTRQSNSGWIAEMQANYKEMTGVDYKDNPTSWGAYQAIYSTQALLTDNAKTAAEGTRQIMEPAFGESEFFAPGEYGYLPPEKIVPFGTEGNWLRNQINIKLIDLAEANHNAPTEQISNLSKVEIAGDKHMVERLKQAAKGNVDQEQLWNYRVGPISTTQSGASQDEPLMFRVNGQDRRVVLQADEKSRLRDGSRLRYTVMTINPRDGTKEVVIDPRTNEPFATITIDSLEEFLPDVYNKMNDELYEKATKETILQRYKEENKIPVLRALGLPQAIREQGPEIERTLRQNEKDYTKSGVIMENQSGTLLHKVDLKKKLGERA